MNFSIIGTGMIAKMMLPEFAKTPNLRCSAVLSRKEESGQVLAEAFQIEKVYTDMDRMLADPDIELVYVATPNNLHYTQTKAALLAGKHVICEKPFTGAETEAAELIGLAKEKGLFLFEAITTAHHPNYRRIRELLPDLGDIKLVQATFCQYSSRYPALLEGKVAPAFDPAYLGGALMDINLYNIHFVVGLFGAPEAVHYYPNRHANGVDTSGVLVLEYPTFVAQCVGAKDSTAENGIQIIGNQGRIQVRPTASICQQVHVQLRGQEAQDFAVEQGPWYYETQDVSRIIAAGDYDACYAILETTRQVVRVLEAARKDAGLGF